MHQCLMYLGGGDVLQDLNLNAMQDISNVPHTRDSPGPCHFSWRQRSRRQIDQSIYCKIQIIQSMPSVTQLEECTAVIADH